MSLVRCKTCCMPTTRPDTAFVDVECTACVSYRKRDTIDWAARERELLALLDRHGGRCIVPSSGGKDSTWQVLKLLELGADVTIVTATTCHLTPLGRANIDNLARFARTIEVTPNRTVRAKLNRLAMQMVGDISWPEHVSIHRVPFRMAVDLGIPLIFYGECPNEAYGGPLGTEGTKQMTQRWASEFGGFLGLRAEDFIGMDGITARDMRDYTAPTDAELQAAGIEAHFLGQYVRWDSHQNAEVAVQNGLQFLLPCQANWWFWENQDNLDTFWHDHAMYRKFGYGRLCAQISVDVRMGRISRERALEVVRSRDGLVPDRYLGIPIEESCKRIGMTMPEMFDCLDNFTDWTLFDGVENGRPILKEFA